MSALPRVTLWTRERVAREFDERGPEACVAEVKRQLKEDNPEFLNIAAKCAADLSDPSKIMIGFGMFYRLLVVASAGGPQPCLLSPLPRITPETRDLLVEEIDEKGVEAFTREVIDLLEESNPELLQMAHNFASLHPDYLRLMQGFGLLYKSLMVQSATERRLLH